MYIAREWSGWDYNGKDGEYNKHTGNGSKDILIEMIVTWSNAVK